MSIDYPIVNVSRDCFRRAGWSPGEAFFGAVWEVDGSNCENRLLAPGATQAEASWNTCLQAREASMLATGPTEEFS